MKTIKITIYELITLIKNKKAPKKIKIKEDIFNLEIGKETLYRFERGFGSLNFDYYIDNNKLDNKVEILDKNFKLEEIPKINKLYINNELQYNLEEKKIPEIVPEALFAEYTKGAQIYQLYKAVSKIIDYLQYLKSKERGE